MHIIDHGEWIGYEPARRPSGLTPNVMFAQRVSDQRDWYEYQRTEFKPDTIKMTLSRVGGRWTVQATALRADRLFPANHRVVEIDEQGDHERFRGRIFDPNSGAFSAPVLQVSRIGFLLALHRDGSLKQAREFIAAHADTPLQIVLDNALVLSSDDEHVRALATALGWSDQKLQALFDSTQEQTWRT